MCFSPFRFRMSREGFLYVLSKIETNAVFFFHLKHAICDVNEIVSHPYCYYEVSEVVSDSIATIPVRAKRKVSTLDAKDSCGLTNFRPWQISGRNCGSNEGTASIMTKIFHACRPLLTTSTAMFVWMLICT